MKKVCAVVLACLTLTGCASALERAMQSDVHFNAAYEPTKGNERQQMFDEVKARLESWGFTIGETGEQDSGWGYMQLASRTILLDPKVEVNAQFEILMHEAGHIFQPPVWNSEEGHRDKAEAFAELVAQGVARFYGIPYNDISYAYLQAYKSGIYIEKLYRKDIQLAVEYITGQRAAPKFAEQKQQQ